MCVRPRSLDAFSHGRSHDAKRSPCHIAISKQARGKRCQTKNLRVGLPHNEGVIKIRDKYGHCCLLSFLDRIGRDSYHYDNLSKRSAFTWKIFSLSISLIWAVSPNRVVRSIEAYG